MNGELRPIFSYKDENPISTIKYITLTNGGGTVPTKWIYDCPTLLPSNYVAPIIKPSNLNETKQRWKKN